MKKFKIQTRKSELIMKLKAVRIYPQLFILILLLRKSVSAQIDWAEDEDDPGKHSKLLCKIIYELLRRERNGHWHITHSQLAGATGTFHSHISFPL